MEKVLITLGDSFTEGVGCYLPDLYQEYIAGNISERDLYTNSTPHWQKVNWANLLGPRVGRTTINLAHGGDGNSTQAKKFYALTDLPESNDVVVIWTLSYPERFSFYSGGKLENYSINSLDEPIARAYFETVYTGLIDAHKETAYYLSSVRALCQSRGWKFYYISAWDLQSDFDKIISFPKNNLIERIRPADCLKQWLRMWTPKWQSHCQHPNEASHRRLADLFQRLLADVNGS